MRIEALVKVIRKVFINARLHGVESRRDAGMAFHGLTFSLRELELVPEIVEELEEKLEERGYVLEGLWFRADGDRLLVTVWLAPIEYFKREVRE